MSERNQTNRWRCCITGCNPVLIGGEAATKHREETGHRIAKWPIRSAAGKAKAHARNKSGYYDKYNVGYKAAEVRGYGRSSDPMDDAHPFSPEALGQD